MMPSSTCHSERSEESPVLLASGCADDGGSFASLRMTGRRRLAVTGRRRLAVRVRTVMRRFHFFSALALALLLAPLAARADQQKVIVLGFDGVDARYTEQWMNEGRLPNLARLRAAGTFRPLRPTLPAQTPVSWSTFSTGIDPGRTGIFDFLRRDPKTYLPLFAAFDATDEPFLLGDKNAPVAAAVVLIVIELISSIFRRTARVMVLI